MLSQWPTLYHLERERERERKKERGEGEEERERKGVGGGELIVVVTKISPSTRRVLTLLARALGPGTNLLLLDVTSLAT